VSRLKKEKNFKKAANIAALISLALLFLSAVKFAVGKIFNAPVLIVDAMHSLGDVITFLGIWIGLKVSSRSPDKRFQYGYYKAESLVALFISILIGYAAIDVLKNAYAMYAKGFSSNIFCVGVAIFSSLFSLYLARAVENAGKKSGSSALEIAGKELKMDVFSALIVTIALISTMLGFPIAELIVSLIIAVFVLKIAIHGIYESVTSLMDVKPDKSIEKRIIEVIKSFDEVEAFRDLKLRKSGPYIFGEVKIKLKPEMKVSEAHEIADRIEENAKKYVPELISFTIHIEPGKGKARIIAVPVNDENHSKIAEAFSACKYIAVFENGKFAYSFENKWRNESVKKGMHLAKEIVKRGIDAVICKNIGEISFHILRDNGIIIFKSPTSNLEKAIDLLKKGALPRMKDPGKEKEKSKR